MIRKDKIHEESPQFSILLTARVLLFILVGTLGPHGVVFFWRASPNW